MRQRGGSPSPLRPASSKVYQDLKNPQGLYCYALALSPLYIAEISPPLLPGHFSLFYVLSLKDCKESGAEVPRGMEQKKSQGGG